MTPDARDRAVAEVVVKAWHELPGSPGVMFTGKELRDAITAALATARAEERAGAVARPLADYHEDDGDVLWWRFPVDEPPYVGTPSDSDWPGYHTHWTPLPPVPADPTRAALRARGEG